VIFAGWWGIRSFGQLSEFDEEIFDADRNHIFQPGCV
jgi:hypothetical protein